MEFVGDETGIQKHLAEEGVVKDVVQLEDHEILALVQEPTLGFQRLLQSDLQRAPRIQDPYLDPLYWIQVGVGVLKMRADDGHLWGPGDRFGTHLTSCSINICRWVVC